MWNEVVSPIKRDQLYRGAVALKSGEKRVKMVLWTKDRYRSMAVTTSPKTTIKNSL